MQIQIATTNQSRTADTSPVENSVVLRDANGGIEGNIVTATVLDTDSIKGTTSTQTSSFTAAAATHYLCDATSAAITVTLPSASAGNVVYKFVKKDSSGNAVTLSGVSGTTSLSTQYQAVTVFNDGSTWFSV